MAVRRDKNGKWRYRKVVHLPDGTQTRVFGTPAINTKLEAERAERAHIDRTLSPPPKTVEALTFAVFVDEKWWPTYPAAAGNRHNTIREKEHHIRVHLKPALGSLPLPQVRGEAVDNFFAQLAAKKLSPKSRKNVRATLRRILASAVEWGYLEALPFLPKIKVPEAPWDFFSLEESTQLLAAARSQAERLLLMFALHTGARAGEQLALQWGDIDFRSNLVVFRRSSTRGVVGHTKSGREAKVPLTASLAAALKAHRHMRSKLVFCNDDGSPLSLWQLHERLEMVCRRAGLRKIRWHDLRHSFASQLAAAGVPIRQIQAWLNHSTIHMSMRYAHLAPDAGAELISALEPSSTTHRGNGVATS
jgi:integrase